MEKEKYPTQTKAMIRVIILSFIITILLPVLVILFYPKANISSCIIIILLGIIGIAASIFITAFECKRAKIVNKLIAKNQYVYAKYETTITNYRSGKYGRRIVDGYKAVFRYTDNYNNSFEFFNLARNLNELPFQPGDCAKVYVDLSSPRYYMVSKRDIMHYSN